jgi:hypothetical protein
MRGWGIHGAYPGSFIDPTGIAIGPTGKIYVLDTNNCRVEVFGPLPFNPTATHSESWGAIKARYR